MIICECVFMCVSAYVENTLFNISISGFSHYNGLHKELKNLWNMNGALILMVIGAFWSVNENLEKVLEEVKIRVRIETTPAIILLK